MRLLDRVAQCRTPIVLGLDDVPGRTFSVEGPSDYARALEECPFRFVLGDDVAEACAELAFADGARLVGCLDLVRIPAPFVWVEWSDVVHARVVRRIESPDRTDDAPVGKRAGALIRASADGRSATIRTFWAEDDAVAPDDVTLSPVVTLVDLDRGFIDRVDALAMFDGAHAQIGDDENQAVSTLLDHVRFRFDDSWQRYYRVAAPSLEIRRAVTRASLAAVARDTPFLLAFFLLRGARDATRVVPISRTSINRRRQARGSMALLDHLEVHESLAAADAFEERRLRMEGRQSPRLHHVRGHLVRRDDHVFWRTSHVRGTSIRGTVRSRTVRLSF